MTERVKLDEHDVVLCILPVPMDLQLFAAMARAADQVSRRRDLKLQPAVILTDGTNRVVARRRDAPARRTPDSASAADAAVLPEEDSHAR